MSPESDVPFNSLGSIESTLAFNDVTDDSLTDIELLIDCSSKSCTTSNVDILVVNELSSNSEGIDISATDDSIVDTLLTKETSSYSVGIDNDANSFDTSPNNDSSVETLLFIDVSS